MLGGVVMFGAAAGFTFGSTQGTLLTLATVAVVLGYVAACAALSQMRRGQISAAWRRGLRGIVWGPPTLIVFGGIASLVIYFLRGGLFAQRAAEQERARVEAAKMSAVQAANSVPFLEWAQGEWSLDREESARETASLYGKGQDNSPGTAALHYDLKPYISTRRVLFLPEALEYHNELNPDLPPPANLPGVGKTYRSTLPKPAKGDSPDRLAVTLRITEADSPSDVLAEQPAVFSKTKSGLLMWVTSSNDGIHKATVFRREEKSPRMSE